jgi:hypothetical protein
MVGGMGGNKGGRSGAEKGGLPEEARKRKGRRKRGRMVLLKNGHRMQRLCLLTMFKLLFGLLGGHLSLREGF